MIFSDTQEPSDDEMEVGDGTDDEMEVEEVGEVVQ